MSITASADTKKEVREKSYEDVYEWLRRQAENLGLRVLLLTQDASLRGGWLYLPTHLEGVLDPYENAIKLQKLEDTWNDREPQPEPPLYLVPVKDPARHAAWNQISDAQERKMQAVAAFGKAASREEQERAAEAFRQAEDEEQEVQRTYALAAG